MGAAIDGNPRQHHDAIGNSAQLGVHGVRPVRVLDFANGHEGFIDWLEEVLVDGEVWLGSPRGYEEELPLLLKTL